MNNSSYVKISLGLILLTVISVTALWANEFFTTPPDEPLREEPVIINEEALPVKPDPVQYSVEKMVTGLEVPWSIVFPTNERWLVSERAGRVRVVENGELLDDPLITFAEVSGPDEAGLMGLALDPNHVDNKLVYACYATRNGDKLIDRVVRFEDRGDFTTQPKTIIDNIPAARFHAGCRLGFGPDGKLYITTGDALEKDRAQELDSLHGKILRINSDGTIPPDNPFPGSPIWTFGHRNPQGIAWQPETGNLFATDHGPSTFDGPPGGDELNIVWKGENYGWPFVSHEEASVEFISPLLLFTPAVAPSGAAFYDSDIMPQFKGDLFFAALKGEGIVRVVMDRQDPTKIAMFEMFPDIDVGRVRDVVEGRDGALYFMTSNRDGRGEPDEEDDAIYRIAAEE